MKKKLVLLTFGLIIVLGFLLRFYRLEAYLTFLGDQGRDLLVVKRMIVDHIPTLLGPTASVGGFYVGPAYYYFLVPFMFVFRLDPFGSAFMSATIGLATLILTYFFVKELTSSKKISLLAAFLTTIAPKFVGISRFSWNPNPMPLFTILTLYLTLLGAKRNKLIYTLFAGVSFGILLQLHYMSLVLVPVLAVAAVLLFWRKRLLLNLGMAVLGVLIGLSPFLLYELRHSFPNLISATEFLTRGTTVAPKSYNPFELYNNTGRILFDTLIGFMGVVPNFFFLTSLLGSAILIFKKKLSRSTVIIVLSYFLLGIITMGLYRGQILDHYYGVLFPLAILMLALTGMLLISYGKVGKVIAIIYFGAFTVFSLKNEFYVFPANNLVQQTRAVSEIALGLTNHEPFNFALITPGNSDHAYRYFMETKGIKPEVIQNEIIDPKRFSVTKQLIVVCEDPKCEPLGNPLWEVAGFGRAEIKETRNGPAGIKVFKLVHYEGE